MLHMLRAVYDDLEDLGVEIFDCKMENSSSICSADGYIGIDERKMPTSSELCTVLIHEAGHFSSGAFYTPSSPFVLREQAEYRANKAAILHYIPKDEIAHCVRIGINELWELAEYFGVNESFMLKAVLYYKSCESEGEGE